MTTVLPLVMPPKLPTLPSLVGYYPFDEGGGGVVRDFSGRENHGAIVGSPSWVVGRWNRALDFNPATPDYIDLGTLFNNLHLWGGITYAAWVTTDTLVGDAAVISQGSGNWVFTGVTLALIGKDVYFWFPGLPIQMVLNAMTLTGVGYHLIGTAKYNDRLQIYINGVQRLDVAYVNTPNAPIGVTRIASSYGGGIWFNNYWDGKIDKPIIIAGHTNESQAKMLYEFNSFFHRGW